MLVDPFLAGPRSLGAYPAYGGFASYAVAPAEAVLPIPGALTFDQACNLLGNYETAYHCLIARGRLAAGETVLDPRRVGLDRARRGARREARRRDGDRDRAHRRPSSRSCSAQGADHVIVHRRACATRVKALTGGRGVDVVYDGVGGDISVESLRCVRFGARFLIVGWAATPFVAQDRPRTSCRRTSS